MIRALKNPDILVLFSVSVRYHPVHPTDLHHVLTFARKHLYQTQGNAWRQLIASLAFETKADLSLIQYFAEADQARLFNILQVFMSRELGVEDLRNYYLEFFPTPERWTDYQDEEGPLL